MKVSLIAAIAQNQVIGAEQGLPWKLPEDLKRFRQLTLGHVIVMGRKTFDSLGRELPKRVHIVISREERPTVSDQVFWVNSYSQALKKASALLSSRPDLPEEVFVIGGAQIYKEAISQDLNYLYLTEIKECFYGDTFFPKWNREAFKEKAREQCLGPIPFDFVVYQKK